MGTFKMTSFWETESMSLVSGTTCPTYSVTSYKDPMEKKLVTYTSLEKLPIFRVKIRE